MWTEMTNLAILERVGKRIAEMRLRKNISQKKLALDAGTSLNTIQRVESGEPVRTDVLVKVMRALGLLENMEGLIPEQPISPIQMKKIQGEKRKRASRTFD